MEIAIWVGINALIGIFMYQDAKERKLTDPGVWIWIGLLFGIFGLLTYWYWHIRSAESNKRKKKRK